MSNLSKNILWFVNSDDEGNNLEPPAFSGDRFLVAIPLIDGRYEYEVVTCCESVGWKGQDGCQWNEWCWDDVECYFPLDKPRTQEEVDEHE